MTSAPTLPVCQFRRRTLPQPDGRVRVVLECWLAGGEGKGELAGLTGLAESVPCLLGRIVQTRGGWGWRPANKLTSKPGRGGKGQIGQTGQIGKTGKTGRVGTTRLVSGATLVTTSSMAPAETWWRTAEEARKGVEEWLVLAGLYTDSCCGAGAGHLQFSNRTKRG